MQGSQVVLLTKIIVLDCEVGAFAVDVTCDVMFYRASVCDDGAQVSVGGHVFKNTNFSTEYQFWPHSYHLSPCMLTSRDSVSIGFHENSQA